MSGGGRSRVAALGEGESPVPKELSAWKGQVRAIRSTPSTSPKRGLVKFILGRLPGASPPALAAKS